MRFVVRFLATALAVEAGVEKGVVLEYGSGAGPDPTPSAADPIHRRRSNNTQAGDVGFERPGLYLRMRRKGCDHGSSARLERIGDLVGHDFVLAVLGVAVVPDGRRRDHANFVIPWCL